MAEAKSDLFRALAHPFRVRILETVAGAGRASVSDLSQATGVKASHLSQHLALLRRQRVITVTRSNGQLFYRLAYPEIIPLLEAARNFLRADLEASREDLARSLAAAIEQSTGAVGPTVPPVQLPADLDVLLHSRSVVDRAVTILMERNACTAEAAQEVLIESARTRKVTVRTVAAEIAGDPLPGAEASEPKRSGPLS